MFVAMFADELFGSIDRTIDSILKCKEEQKYTAHQRKIEYKLRKWYGRTIKENLTRIRTLLKQDHASACEKFMIN